jgi:hypothetical protein
MTSLRYNILPALALGVVLLAGCGPSSPDTRRESAASLRRHFVTGPNACDVLNDAAAKQLLGDSAHLTRKAQPNPHMTQCQYTSPNGQITIMVGDWKMLHDDNPQNKVIAGLGDEAYDTPSGVDVRKGDIGMNVDVMVASGEFWGKAADDMLAQTDAAEKKVAAALLPNL